MDLTRRDLQHKAKADRRPWDAAKGFDDSAPVGALTPGYVPDGGVGLELTVGGEVKQACTVGQMIYGVADIIHHLSHEVELCPGDVIFTGTPAGVGPLQVGDEVTCTATDSALQPCTFTIAAPL